MMRKLRIKGKLVLFQLTGRNFMLLCLGMARLTLTQFMHVNLKLYSLV